MGKKNKDKNLGRSLIKKRFGSIKYPVNDDSHHVCNHNMQDSDNLNPLNIQSITEESSFQEFFNTANLLEKDFQEKTSNIKFVHSKDQFSSLFNKKDKQDVKLQEINQKFLQIPRRPEWNKLTTVDELHNKEKEEFLVWRRKLAFLEETKNLILTPYEKNLEFWRQLWRVVERSDLIVQIVDARNPLLFRCKDLEQYVKEINPNKRNMILLNKADFLNIKQRKIWADYFSKLNVQVAFFSAISTVEKSAITDDSFENTDLVKEISTMYISNTTEKSENNRKSSNLDTIFFKEIESTKIKNNTSDTKSIKESVNNSFDLLTTEELINLFKSICSVQDHVTTIGFVGYPNVGKSSTINALLKEKKVSVSATPGKTKHLQTLYLQKDLLICDCPGLVMPSFVNTKAEMLLNGILPINQIRDHTASINLIGTLIPRSILEDLYGIMIPLPSEGDDPDRPPTAEEILNAHGYNRGFMTQNGQPDNARSARYILKDFVTGKLLYCAAPPDYKQNDFHRVTLRNTNNASNSRSLSKVTKATRTYNLKNEELDSTFFTNNSINVHIKGNKSSLLQLKSDVSPTEIIPTICSTKKPWKQLNKHINKNKREKSRRLYICHDQH